MPQLMPDIAIMRQLIALVWLVGAGGGIAVAEVIPLPRARPPVSAPPWAQPAPPEPHSFRAAAGADFNTAEVTDKPTDCDLRLEKIAAIEPMPRLIGPGACGGGDMVRIDAVLLPDRKRIEIKPAPYLRCPMAEQLAGWVRDDAAVKVAAAGPALRSVETYDDFECRGRNRQTNGKVSEHGKGNAIDVRGFTLADGRFIGLTDMAASKELRADLRKSACARFTTVLGPGSDGYHEQHIHLDLIERRNGYRICEWDVREPKPPMPPLPPAKPPEVAKTGEVASVVPQRKSDVAPAAAAASSIKVPAEAVPLPPPRPALAVRHERRKTRRSFHLPFTLWR